MEEDAMGMITDQTMRQEHPRWAEFMAKLIGSEALSITTTPEGRTVWTCDGEHPPTQAQRILRSMEGVDVEASIEYFAGRGAYCDCEIVWNVDATREDPREEGEGG